MLLPQAISVSRCEPAMIACPIALYGQHKPPWLTWMLCDHIAIYWRAEYYPYGNIFALRAGDVHQPLRLPGQVAEQFDTGANGSTSSSNNGFRWYRPDWGRYTQIDLVRLSPPEAWTAYAQPTAIASGTNLYAYAQDNPLRIADPLGLMALDMISDCVGPSKPTPRPKGPWMGPGGPTMGSAGPFMGAGSKTPCADAIRGIANARGAFGSAAGNCGAFVGSKVDQCLHDATTRGAALYLYAYNSWVLQCKGAFASDPGLFPTPGLDPWITHPPPQDPSTI